MATLQSNPEAERDTDVRNVSERNVGPDAPSTQRRGGGIGMLVGVLIFAAILVAILVYELIGVSRAPHPGATGDVPA